MCHLVENVNTKMIPRIPQENCQVSFLIGNTGFSGLCLTIFSLFFATLATQQVSPQNSKNHHILKLAVLLPHPAECALQRFEAVFYQSGTSLQNAVVCHSIAYGWHVVTTNLPASSCVNSKRHPIS
jgi:hypothetical protein